MGESGKNPRTFNAVRKKTRLLTAFSASDEFDRFSCEHNSSWGGPDEPPPYQVNSVYSERRISRRNMNVDAYRGRVNCCW